MKYSIINMVIYLSNLYYLFQINIIYAKTNIIITDIDNTIAHTYPEINKGGLKTVASQLQFFPYVIKYINEMQKELNAKIIFLTVRPLSLFFITQKWLKKTGFKEVNFLNLFFAKKASQKTSLLQKVKTKNRTIVFLDDMSYNTENGTTLFYENEINSLTSIDIKYINYQTILSIQNGYFKTII